MSGAWRPSGRSGFSEWLSCCAPSLCSQWGWRASRLWPRLIAVWFVCREGSHELAFYPIPVFTSPAIFLTVPRVSLTSQNEKLIEKPATVWAESFLRPQKEEASAMSEDNISRRNFLAGLATTGAAATLVEAQTSGNSNNPVVV